jgi:hypothetical protein
VPDATGTLELPSGRAMLHLVARLPGTDGVVRSYVLARSAKMYW